MFKKKNKKQKEFGFLSRKDKNYIKELLENGIIKAMSEQDKINITHDDVEKIEFIMYHYKYSDYSWYSHIQFFYHDILKVTLNQLEIFYKYITVDRIAVHYEDVECMLKNEYNLAKIVEKIMLPYLYANHELDEDKYIEEIKAIKSSDFDRNKALRYNGKALRRLIHKRYSIDQILFIFNNNMIYSSYHDIFDYDVIYKECKKLGYDVTKRYVNEYSLEFLKSIKEDSMLSDESSRSYILNLISEYTEDGNVVNRENVYKTFKKYEFRADEIVLVCERKDIIRPQALEAYFRNGGKKEELILKCAIENTKSNKEGE